jgi:hypothetical protein
MNCRVLCYEGGGFGSFGVSSNHGVLATGLHWQHTLHPQMHRKTGGVGLHHHNRYRDGVLCLFRAYYRCPTTTPRLIMNHNIISTHCPFSAACFLAPSLLQQINTAAVDVTPSIRGLNHFSSVQADPVALRALCCTAYRLRTNICGSRYRGSDDRCRPRMVNADVSGC